MVAGGFGYDDTAATMRNAGRGGRIGAGGGTAGAESGASNPKYHPKNRQDGGDSGILGSAEAFDPATQVWSRLPGMLLGVSFAAAGEINGRLYVAGGNAGFNKGGISKIVQVFEPAGTKKGAKGGGDDYDDDEKGVDGASSNPPRSGNNNNDEDEDEDSVEALSQRGKWRRLKSMPAERAQAASAVIGGKLYVIGGINKQYQVRSSVFVYDPRRNRWSEKEGVPVFTAPEKVAKGNAGVSE